MLQDRLKLLTNDNGVMHMLNIAMLNDVVHLYVVHKTLEPEIIEIIQWDKLEVHGQFECDGEGKKQLKEGSQLKVDGELGLEILQVSGQLKSGECEKQLEEGGKLEGDAEHNGLEDLQECRQLKGDGESEKQVEEGGQFKGDSEGEKQVQQVGS